MGTNEFITSPNKGTYWNSVQERSIIVGRKMGNLSSHMSYKFKNNVDMVKDFVAEKLAKYDIKTIPFSHFDNSY